MSVESNFADQDASPSPARLEILDKLARIETLEMPDRHELATEVSLMPLWVSRDLGIPDNGGIDFHSGVAFSRIVKRQALPQDRLTDPDERPYRFDPKQEILNATESLRYGVTQLGDRRPVEERVAEVSRDLAWKARLSGRAINAWVGRVVGVDRMGYDLTYGQTYGVEPPETLLEAALSCPVSYGEEAPAYRAGIEWLLTPEQLAVALANPGLKHDLRESIVDAQHRLGMTDEAIEQARTRAPLLARQQEEEAKVYMTPELMQAATRPTWWNRLR